MLRVYSKNEEELAIILGNLKDCKVVMENVEAEQEKVELVKVPGTCSDCPHFTSRKDSYRGRYVKWGYCRKLDANVNEGMKQCSMQRKEADIGKGSKQEVKRVYVA